MKPFDIYNLSKELDLVITEKHEQKGWDGDDAAPITKKLKDYCLLEFKLMCNHIEFIIGEDVEIKMPEITPNTDGSISIHFKTDECDTVIRFSISDDGNIMEYFGETKSKKASISFTAKNFADNTLHHWLITKHAQPKIKNLNKNQQLSGAT